MKIQPLNISPLFFSAKAKQKKKKSSNKQNSEMTSTQSATIRSSRIAEVEKPNFWKQTAMLTKEARNRGDVEAQELWGYVTKDNFEVAQILFSDEKYQEIDRLNILQTWEKWDDIQKSFFKNLCTQNTVRLELMSTIAGYATKENQKVLDEICNDKDFSHADYLEDVLSKIKQQATVKIYEILRPNETIRPTAIAQIMKRLPDRAFFEEETVALAFLISEDNFDGDSGEVDLHDLFNEVNNNNIRPWIEIHRLMKKHKYSDYMIHEIMLATSEHSFLHKKRALEYIEKIPNFPKDIAGGFIRQAGPSRLMDEPIEKGIALVERANEIRRIMLANPELYIQGDCDSKEKMQELVDDFLNNNLFNLIETLKVFDKETTLTVLRQRFHKAAEIMRKVSKEDCWFGYDEIELLSVLINAKNVDGKEFSPKEKIEFVNLIETYTRYLPQEKFKELLKLIQQKPQEINITQIQNTILEELFKKCDIDKKYIASMPDEERKHWLDNCHYIFQAKENLKSFSEIIKTSFECNDFKSTLKTEQTMCFFESFGLDFNSWFNPSANNYVQFKSKDTSEDRIKQIVSQIEEDFESLRQTPAKGFIDKHFSDFVNSNEFNIPEKYHNKQALTTFLKTAYELLDKSVFKRAQKNADSINKIARLTLTIKNHLEQRIKDIEELDDTKTKSLDLTIKTWDRNPKIDLFQGNYSSCCIGIGSANQSAIIDYLTNPTFNMIELVDNKTNQIVGNALCYFAKDVESNKPVFIIDNIEIAPKYKPSDKTGVELRNAIVEYCKNILKSVGVDDDTPIYLGQKYNDLSSADLKTTTKKIEFPSKENKNLYLDAFGGWTWSAHLTNKAKVFYELN